MKMLNHVKNLVKRTDYFSQNGVVASDSGGDFFPKKFEFRTYAN